MSDDAAFRQELIRWRHHLHAHPEFGFQERQTADFVVRTLRDIGVDDIAESIGGTGVVATLRRGSGDRTIALRADMDALRIAESVDRPHKSRAANTMHACGHDGHTVMLLGAARLLGNDRALNGTVRLIFQPAEEWGRGALAMLDDGLLERFPFSEIYGVHNWPGLPLGSFTSRPGALMSAEDNFEIVLEGLGGHASRPNAGRETMVAGCSLVIALQTIVSRRIDPSATAVVSVTEFVTDGTRNVLPGIATIRGDVRSFDAAISAEVETEMRRIAAGIATAHGLSVRVTYTREFVPLINDPACTAEAIAVAEDVWGADNVSIAAQPATASEDFARFLERVPGCFGFIGNGEDSLPLHNSAYDFADSNLSDGARFLAGLARRRLAA